MADPRPRCAVVTGGASGIGRAITEILARRGDRVLVADIDEGAAADLAAELGEGASFMRCDVSDHAAVEALADRAFELFGQVDLVFANAGTIINGPLIAATPQELDWIFGVNVRGAWSTMSAFARRMRASGQEGRICVTASEHSLGLQHTGAGLYTATKHAVMGLADVMREELAPLIGITVFCPGLVATNLAHAPRPANLRQPSERAVAFGAAVQSRGMPSEEAARAAVEGTGRGERLIVTHAESWPAARRRAEMVEAAFAAQAPWSEGLDRYDVNRVVKEVREAEEQAKDAAPMAP
jgi:NAD(P)-dependent dehydrogenase (short-subunit alcohol dehydrogenase family)